MLLEIVDSEASSRLATDAVSSHMCILMGVIDHKFVITKAPSEPILAITAVTALNEGTEDRRNHNIAMEVLLEKFILHGIVLNRGIQGELCSRLLLTLTQDKAAMTTPEGFAGLNAINPIKLLKFLEMLLGHDLGLCREDNKQINMRKCLRQWAD